MPNTSTFFLRLAVPLALCLGLPLQLALGVDFNFKEMNRQLAGIKRGLNRIQNMKTLLSWRGQMDHSTKKAKICSEFAEENYKFYHEELQKTQDFKEGTNLKAELNYLQKKKKKYGELASQCRLYSLKAREIEAKLTEALAQKAAMNTLKKSPTLLDMLSESYLSYTQGQRKVHRREILDSFFGSSFLTWKNLIYSLIILLLSSLIIVNFNKLISHLQKDEQKHFTWAQSIRASIDNRTLLLTVLFSLTVYTFLFSYPTFPIPMIVLIFFGIFARNFLITISGSLIRKVGFLKGVDYQLKKKLGNLFLYAFIFWAYHHSFALEERPQGWKSLLELFLLLPLSYACWRFLSNLGALGPKGHMLKLFNFFTRISLLLFLTLICTGHKTLAFTIIYGELFIMAWLIGLWFLRKGLKSAIHHFYSSDHFLFVDIREHLRAKEKEKLLELHLISYSLMAIGLYLFIISTLTTFGVSPAVVDKISHLFSEGVSFSQIKIMPLRIIIAVILFGILSLLTKWIATTANRSYRDKDLGELDEDQVQIGSLLSYIGISITLIICLLVAGVNLTGITVVAGALSVGIGLGLQNIVNNFVSGIILLIERPIRPGDRIGIGGTEGTVKRIRFRSTQITTLNHEDVIIPNSDLITNSVTNFMFHDRSYKIECEVGVEYASDPELVKTLLMKLARNHREIIQKYPKEPKVIFHSFGDSALIFKVWAVVKDVNRRFEVKSELNFQIEKAFKERGIVVAFPQLDLHLKQAVGTRPALFDGQ